MRNKIMFMASAGSVAMILSGVAMAAGPDSLTNWSVAGGTIAAGACPTNYSCVILMTGDGFLQRQLTAGNGAAEPVGTSYYQTIVTDKGATGNPTSTTPLSFFDSNFVKIGAVNGISDMQSVSQLGSLLPVPSTIDFVTTSAVDTGWALASGNSKITLHQSLTDTASIFVSNFDMAQEANASGSPVISKVMSMDQVVGLAGAGPTADTQVFRMREAGGTAVAAGGAFSLPPLPTSTGGTQTLAFAAGENVRATLIGQQVTLAGTGTGSAQQVFGFQAYDKVDPVSGNSTANINYFSLTAKPLFDTAPNPTWKTAIFGPVPTF